MPILLKLFLSGSITTEKMKEVAKEREEEIHEENLIASENEEHEEDDGSWGDGSEDGCEDGGEDGIEDESENGSDDGSEDESENESDGGRDTDGKLESDVNESGEIRIFHCAPMTMKIAIIKQTIKISKI